MARLTGDEIEAAFRDGQLNRNWEKQDNEDKRRWWIHGHAREFDHAMEAQARAERDEARTAIAAATAGRAAAEADNKRLREALAEVERIHTVVQSWGPCTEQASKIIRAALAAPPAPEPAQGPRPKCADCGVNEADECFTVCGPCWDKAYAPPPAPVASAPERQGCNKHEDCSKKPAGSDCCHDEDCEDCFGS